MGMRGLVRVVKAGGVYGDVSLVETDVRGEDAISELCICSCLTHFSNLAGE